MTDGPILPFVCTQTSMCLSPCRLRTRACPSVWCHYGPDSSVNIQCHQGRMLKQTGWSLAHRWWCRRCTKSSLGYRAGLREWCPTSRRHRVMVRVDRRDPRRWIGRSLNLGLDRNLFTCMALSNYWSPWVWNSFGDLWLEIQSVALLHDRDNDSLYDTRNSSIINLLALFTRKSNNELQYSTWDMAWHFLSLAKFRPERHFIWWIWVNLTPFAHQLTHLFKFHRLYSSKAECTLFVGHFLTVQIISRNWGIYFKSITSNTIYFAFSEIKISLQRKIFQWIGRQFTQWAHFALFVSYRTMASQIPWFVPRCQGRCTTVPRNASQLD